jgi:hypothetical protein
MTISRGDLANVRNIGEERRVVIIFSRESDFGVSGRLERVTLRTQRARAEDTTQHIMNTKMSIQKRRHIIYELSSKTIYKLHDTIYEGECHQEKEKSDDRIDEYIFG